jgi:CAAX prenyl protease-like protein
LLLGLAVFAAWVAPDLLFPGYRSHWLFQNAVTGTLQSSLTESARGDGLVLALRALRAVVLVPVIEELFWRAWLMRWLINPDFRKVALGTFSIASFAVTAFLFGSEHGPYWEVGVVAGVAYNWWMVRTHSLGDCILAHAVTNACLSVFVLVTGKWEYWL